jgi:peptidyl-tRNA hydrolase, PTH1 family
MKLIVGLGNPGREYADTRHNIGFMCLNRFAKRHRIKFDKKQSKARTGAGIVAEQEVLLARPQTFMNRSGESVKLLMDKFKIDLSDLIVVYDDLDLPLGKIRIRPDGGSGGHNGLKSILAELGSNEFIRIRVGIGRPDITMKSSENPARDHVLGDFDREENELLEDVISRVSHAIFSILTEGPQAAMNRFN